MSDIYAPTTADRLAGNDNPNERGMAPPGLHNFAVYEASKEQSKSNGLDMYKLRLRLMDNSGESPWSDVYCYLAWPHEERVKLAEAAGKGNPNPFLRDQLEGFFASIGWNTAPVEQGGQGKPRTEIETKRLCGQVGEVEFRMGKPSTGPDGTAYPAKLEPDFKNFKKAQSKRAASPQQPLQPPSSPDEEGMPF